MTTAQKYQFLFIALSFLMSSGSMARGTGSTLVPLPSVVDYTQGDGWASGAGLKIESSAAYAGSNTSMVEIKPEGAMQWRRGDHVLFWEGFDLNDTELGWRARVQNNWLLEGGARHEIVIPTSRGEKAGIDNLPHRGSHILGFYETKYSIDNAWKNWVSARVLFGSKQYGWQSKLAAGRRFSEGFRNNGAELIAFTTFGSQENINNYFGISEQDSIASGLTAINLEGGYRSSGLELIYRQYVNKKVQLTAKAGVELYSTDIRKSELVKDSPETNLELSLVWH